MSEPFVVVTIATSDHLCRCQVLFESLRRFHPEARGIVFMLDPWPAEAPSPGDLFQVEEVSRTDVLELRRRLFRYTPYERASSLKAIAMQRALAVASDCRKVIFLDADIEVYAPLDPVLTALEGSNIVLTPHLVYSDGRHGGWKTASKFGVFNGGFFAVRRGTESARFLRWFDDRLATECYNDIPEGAFNDQRWLDHVPALFDGVLSCRHPGLNVAYWNLFERSVGGTPQAPTVDGQPLIFYHYSGWDPGRPTILSRYQGGTAAPVSEDTLLGRLLSRYWKVTKDSTYFGLRHAPSVFSLYDDGRRIDEMDHIYFSEFLERELPVNFDPYGGLPNSTPLAWVRLVGRIAHLAGYRLDGKRQFLLYRWTRRALQHLKGRNTRPGL